MHKRRKAIRNVNVILDMMRDNQGARIEIYKRGAFFKNGQGSEPGNLEIIDPTVAHSMVEQGLLMHHCGEKFFTKKILILTAYGMAYRE